jgi:hypothetical protein
VHAVGCSKPSCIALDFGDGLTVSLCTECVLVVGEALLSFTKPIQGNA